MEEREKNIIEAAIRVFTRYGVRRTTMNDIAGEAGIVRQTLYNAYSNKDELLRATIRWFADQSLAKIDEKYTTARSLGDRLDIMFRHWAVEPFELLSATPHADDIISGFNDAAKDEISSANDRFRAVIERALEPHGEQIRAAGSTPRQLSDFIQNAVVGFKHNADSKAHLLELLATLKKLVLTVADDD